MRNMMSQVRNYKNLRTLSVCVLCSVFCVLTGCKGKNDPVNPYATLGTTENPNWVITVENDMTTSMTAVVRVSFTEQPGILAAFIGNDCCGIAEYIADYEVYVLYISPAAKDQSQTSDVQLRFYSPGLKRIYEATTTFPFRNEAQLGSPNAPYSPDWIVLND